MSEQVVEEKIDEVSQVTEDCDLRFAQCGTDGFAESSLDDLLTDEERSALAEITSRGKRKNKKTESKAFSAKNLLGLLKKK